MERNVEKVRRLERELRAAKEKCVAQDHEIIRLHKARQDTTDGLNELQDIAKSLYIGMAKKYGSEVSPGVWELVLPARLEGAVECHKLNYRTEKRGIVVRVSEK